MIEVRGHEKKRQEVKHQTFLSFFVFSSSQLSGNKFIILTTILYALSKALNGCAIQNFRIKETD